VNDQKVEIKVDANKLNAFVILNDENVSEESIYTALKSSGIKFGIMEEKVRSAIKNFLPGEPILVAQGIPALAGKDATVEYKLTNEAQKRKPVITDDGKVDYKVVNDYNLVSAGEVLAIKHPLTRGKDGKDIFGNKIPSSDGKDVKIIPGKNTHLTEDGMNLVASKSGIFFMHESTVEVKELLEVKGDVDYSTGNIDFPGDVHIKGGVRPNFVVKAKGDIKVEGIVEAATIESEMGIWCHGVKGRNKGILHANGDVRTNFLENAFIECKGTLYVRDSIVNSSIRAGKMVEVVEGKGEIVSSDVIAQDLVMAKQLGSLMSSTTHIEVGVNPEVRDKISELSAKIYMDKENLEKISRLMKVLERLRKQKGGTLPDDREEAYTKLKKTRYSLYKALSEMMAEMKECQNKIDKGSSQGTIVATARVYPGVELKIGEQRLLVDVELGPTKFVNVDEKILATPYAV